MSTLKTNRIENLTTTAGGISINNSGQVGIGTTSPTTNLEINGGTNNNIVRIVSTDANANIEFADNTTTSGCQIGANGDNLKFGINGTEAMRIDSSGRLLHGTTTVPTGLLLGNSLVSASSTGSEFVAFRSDTSVAVGDKCGAFVIGNSDTDGVEDHFVGMWGKVASTNGSMDLHFAASRASYEGDTPDVTIKSGGNVAIGTTSADERLHVQQGGGSSARVKIEHESTGVAGIVLQNTNRRYDVQLNGSDIQIYDSTGSTERMRIASSGNVGIGTTGPSTKLHVKPASDVTTDGLRIQRQADNGQFLLLNYFGGTGQVAAVDTAGSSPVLRFTRSTDNSTYTESMRIDSSGRVMIGDTDTSNAATYADDLVIGDAGGDHGMTIVAGSGSFGTINFSDGAGSNATQGIIQYSHSANYMRFYTSDTERMRIDSSGNAIFRNSSFVYPQTDNAVALGGGVSFRWSAVYAANGTIQTSDGRHKTEVADSALAINFVKSLRPVSYKWIEGGKRDTGNRDEDNNYIYESVPGQRTHWGFIAQEVKQAADDAGVDFGGWVLTDKDDADSQQALRYDQFIAPLTKALQEAIAKIETLEAEVAALKSN